MATGIQSKNTGLKNQMAVQLRKRTSKTTQYDSYCQHYFENVAPEDMKSLSEDQKANIAEVHWKIAQKRMGKTPVIHVYNPEKINNGWYSHCTVIDIVTPNIPFLVDSVRMEINRQGYAVNIIMHPIYRVERNLQGKLQIITANSDNEGPSDFEAFIHVEIERQVDAESLAELETGLGRVLADVRSAVDDWKNIRERLKTTIEEFDTTLLPTSRAHEVSEALAFLEWLDRNHFTFLGCRDYAFTRKNNEDILRTLTRSGLGILRDPERRTLSTNYATMPPEIRKQLKTSELLIISKASARSTVHRPGHLDYIGIKRFDKRGNIIGERRFLGLYTSTAYRRSPNDIPYLRGKISRVFARSKLDPVSHSGKSLMHVLETFPRDELFQISDDDLYKISKGIVHLGESQRIKLFVRNDRYLRFISCIVYVPRDKYDTNLRLQISDILRDEFKSNDVVFNVRLTDEAMARIEFVVKTDPGGFPDYSEASIEKRIIEATQTWDDHFKLALHKQFNEQGGILFKDFKEMFPVVYKADFDGKMAVDDIMHMQLLSDEDALNMRVCQPGPNQSGLFRFRLYKKGEAIAPSDSLPILENMGVRVIDEVPYPIKWWGGGMLWIHDYGLNYAYEQKIPSNDIKQNFEQVFNEVWSNSVENDRFNQLVLKAGLRCREVTIVRAYCKYLLQTSQRFSQSYMEEALIAYPEIVKMLIELFFVRFDPAFDKDRETSSEQIEKKMHKAFDDVASLDQDSILRNFANVISATIRTNFFQTFIDEKTGNECYKSYISFKFDSSKVAELPDPRPMFEVFVYSPRVEGVHLRGGKVARGGLRWSDRREDFRTEVLGLVKAQMVKNSVIVPVGAKGGFVVKQPPVSGDRDEMMDEVKACYTNFISGLLDITDNIKLGNIIHPEQVVHYDEDDPYMVVAADKGTATFSDLANSVALKYEFWLGDAFASGGSNGYDHKKMGITAKGAWESVKLLFRDLGKNIQEEDFLVVGIGDMSGDVFGNGMLLSKHIKLVAAFNHMHIFIDPSPNSQKSYDERMRLFKLPRSTWEDYNTKLISKGGGVFSRAAKSISITPQMKSVLGIKENSLAPNMLVRAILEAPVELLWNGGIGTYVKSSSEQHSNVGDRTNDSVRVDATSLQCKVIGEGGNLGLTQKARIEFSRQGGRMDTDFIHNSGGVDCSDREVNIKILLNALKDTCIINEKQRIKLLSEMTDDVSEFVLYDNYWQGLAITLIEARAADQIEEHARFMRHLEHNDQLNRGIEFLPNDEELQERKAAGEGLVRPELAVLVSYAKMVLFAELVNSDIWQDEYFSRELERYFPVVLRKKYAQHMQEHHLRCEILSAFIVNRLVNRMGCTFAFHMEEDTGASFAEITRAYTIAWETFDLRQLWREIAALDNKIPGNIQTEMMLELVNLIQRSSQWLLQHRRRSLNIRETIETYHHGAQVLSEMLPRLFERSRDENLQASIKHLTDNGVSKQLALHVVAMDAYYCAFDLVLIENKLDLDIESIGEVYFRLSAYLSLYWLRIQIKRLAVENHWQKRANSAMSDDLYQLLRDLSVEVLRFNENCSDDLTPREKIENWHSANKIAVDRYLNLVSDLKVIDNMDQAMISVTLREIGNMLQASIVR